MVCQRRFSIPWPVGQDGLVENRLGQAHLAGLGHEQVKASCTEAGCLYLPVPASMVGMVRHRWASRRQAKTASGP
jgi:hypothetical protein